MSGDATPSRNGKPKRRRAPRELLASPKQRELLMLIETASRPVSSTDLARLTGQTLGAVAHHVRTLHKKGLIDVVGERRVRGAHQTFYKTSEKGKSVMRRPRLGAVVEIVGMPRDLPAVNGGALPKRLPQEWDEQAEQELEGLIERLRPQLERIYMGLDARTRQR